MRKAFLRGVITLGLGWLLLGNMLLPVTAAADPVVHAVLFYSPSCGHCHHVIETVLPPLIEQYGSRFQIVGINVSEPNGQALYQAAIAHYKISEDRLGVPTLILGETVLVGSGEIPEQLPGRIESYLAEGGVGWPDLPGLAEALAANAPTPTATAVPAETPVPVQATPVTGISGFVAEKTDWRARFAQDPLGNGISLLVLLGMVASVLYQGFALNRPPSTATRQNRHRAIPPLVVLGIIVAGYLAYVETQQVAAVCGPVGDCNAVQQSEYARLFGVLPIAVLGLLGYLGIGAAWAGARWLPPQWGRWAQLALGGMAWFGIFFSIYLTFLEPFVIGATCAWCLTSAVVMTLVFWIAAPLVPKIRYKGEM